MRGVSGYESSVKSTGSLLESVPRLARTSWFRVKHSNHDSVLGNIPHNSGFHKARPRPPSAQHVGQAVDRVVIFLTERIDLRDHIKPLAMVMRVVGATRAPDDRP
jgi:hypothetical protein